jgi:hypothetical protein
MKSGAKVHLGAASFDHFCGVGSIITLWKFKDEDLFHFCKPK